MTLRSGPGHCHTLQSCSYPDTVSVRWRDVPSGTQQLHILRRGGTDLTSCLPGLALEQLQLYREPNLTYFVRCKNEIRGHLRRTR